MIQTMNSMDEVIKDLTIININKTNSKIKLSNIRWNFKTILMRCISLILDVLIYGSLPKLNLNYDELNRR